ncbi:MULTISPECIES: hypothetical protein [Gammaproteobacteria]|jgi:hypothetical protein|uniref:Secreted protein n=1 Tax=Xanthomonas boreopolis TaxID=86183 RepID=A0A919KIA7_9XANT|nr:hypothetical protein [Pseudomonas sp. Hp2]GHH54318.1 hypothetical protein GCM10009090_20930 [[Pseudomonas] boreopolis]
MRRLAWLSICLLLLAGSAQALSRAQQRSLQETQSLYAAAVRWSDLDRAEEMVDPEYREKHPQTDLERARYEQVQISGYSELRSGTEGEDRVVREVEIRLINRNTLAERSVRVREVWRWDPKAKQWWLASGLPDLWKGE